jgi:hypothetical protein
MRASSRSTSANALSASSRVRTGGAHGVFTVEAVAVPTSAWKEGEAPKLGLVRWSAFQRRRRDVDEDDE